MRFRVAGRLRNSTVNVSWASPCCTACLPTCPRLSAISFTLPSVRPIVPDGLADELQREGNVRRQFLQEAYLVLVGEILLRSVQNERSYDLFLDNERQGRRCILGGFR